MQSSAIRGAVVSGPSKDDRPPLVVAMQWITQITTVALMMVLPATLGYYVDRPDRWGMEPWLMICGVVIGFATGTFHLLQMVGAGGKKNHRNKHIDSSGTITKTVYKQRQVNAVGWQSSQPGCGCCWLAPHGLWPTLRGWKASRTQR